MRAGVQLRALSRLFDVHLFIVPIFASPGARADVLSRYAQRVGRLDLRKHLDPLFGLIARVKDPEERHRALLDYPKPSLGRFCTSGSAAAIRDWYGPTMPDAVYVMRLYLAPLAAPFQDGLGVANPITTLDLDDDETTTRQRLAALHRSYGRDRQAAREEAEGRRYVDWAARHFARFDRVLTCSDADAERLQRDWPEARFAVLPNAVATVPPHRPPATSGVARLLFLGNLSYDPNADAAATLIDTLLPRLRSLTNRQIPLDIVGGGAGRSLRRLLDRPGVNYRGFVRDVEPVYRAATAVVAPIRAGGGTRVKIIDAFARSVPVIATAMAAEGLTAAHGRHLMIADDPAAFAAAGRRLIDNPDFAGRLARNARYLARRHYSLDAVTARFAALYNADPATRLGHANPPAGALATAERPRP